MTSPQGLTSEQVAAKVAEGKVNRLRKKATTKTVPQIILSSTFTMFNFVNFILALAIILVGSYKNLLFILVALANTLISIINEIRAKRTIDKLKLQAEQNPTVIRDGQARQIPADQIVEGDLLVLSLGNQILVDSKVLSGEIEVNESYVTGEQDNVAKGPGEKLISGSFVVSGTCTAEVTAVGAQNFLAKLESSAKSIKPSKSQLFLTMNNIVKYISFALIPIGILLLISRFRVHDTTPEIAVTSTVAALISMIPEGLVLLTSSVLALATVRLGKKQVLVQDLYSIETLARVDTICLDKTGTLTTGQMHVKTLVPAADHDLNTLQDALRAVLSRSPADNATSAALKEKLLKTAKFAPTAQNAKSATSPVVAAALLAKDSSAAEFIPFSSDRKYSGLRTPSGEILMGALEFITKDPAVRRQASDLLSQALASEAAAAQTLLKADSDDSAPVSGHKVVQSPAGAAAAAVPTASQVAASQSSQHWLPKASDPGNYRVISVVERRDGRESLLGLALLEDELRPDAPEIIRYFTDNDVAIKIISGDNLETVQTITKKVGVPATAAVDLSTQSSRPNYSKLVKDYQIFTRVTPAQKKRLIQALKADGHTVAMTGDGVNDILAMKEADCSIAIGAGADAARRAARLVLLDSDFAAVPSIIAEGRQTINNLERSTTLFLTKTIYASILATLFALLPLEYPYSPIEMSLLNALCIGLPGLALALETNTERVKDQFAQNIKRYSLPTGIIIAVAMFALALIDAIFHLTRPVVLTCSLIGTFVLSMILLYRISKPLNTFRTGLLITIIVIFVLILLIPPFRHLFIL